MPTSSKKIHTSVLRGVHHLIMPPMLSSVTPHRPFTCRHLPDQSGRHQYESQAGMDVLHARGTFNGGAVTDEAWEEAMVGVGKDRRGQ